jgi:hypothetical protein
MASPGHPILADAIETVVNQVRNDSPLLISQFFVPDIPFLLGWEVLLISGPCLLETSINRALGRDSQMHLGQILSLIGQRPVPNHNHIRTEEKDARQPVCCCGKGK